MVFWWTRKPLISARAIIAGCLLPADTNPSEFLRAIGIGGKSKAAHRNELLYRFEGIRLLDPFAGFGSIPLEAMRMGIDATAVELLPTAYIFLKAVLEYPSKYGKKLVEDVKRWGEWVTQKLREDPLIKELYEDDVAVYIGSWEIKCPHCSRWTPLVGNWWLARVREGEGYGRLAWMEPVVEDNSVKIRIIDLNKVLGDGAVKGARVSGLKITAGGKEFRVPESNIEARREKAVCLLCHQPIMQIDPQTGKHYTETKGLPHEVRERLKGYVKFALELFNNGMGYGINTELPSWINEVPARQRLLVKVKVKQRDLEFEACTENDQEKLEKAKEEIKKLLEINDPDIPREGISLYSVRYLFPILYGMTEWYKLFNPRQLMTHVKLVKLIRETGKQIEQEKISEGLSKEESFEYAEGVTAYLTIALCKHADYDFLCNLWDCNIPKISHGLTMRGIAMMWNWVDICPRANFTGSWIRVLGQCVEGLFYINSQGSRDCTKVLLDDAATLSKVSDGKFTLIITDPPYYDDVPYAELSDFYYVWLKRALSEVEDNRLVPEVYT
jgi:putative DNA methylase